MDCNTQWIEHLNGEDVCANCVHYLQHYIRSSAPGSDSGYIPAINGMCEHPRKKPRRIYDTCEKYQRKE